MPTTQNNDRLSKCMLPLILFNKQIKRMLRGCTIIFLLKTSSYPHHQHNLKG